MKALISTIEPVQTGYRVAQVEPNENIFEVADDLFWVECPENIIPDHYWFNSENGTFVEIIENIKMNQPATTGTQTF